MRKVILALMLLVLIFVQAVPALAEEVTQITITASAQEAKPGDEVTFTVTIDGGESCRYYGLILEYDPDVYEMGNGECTISGAMFSAFDPERGFVVLNDKERVPQGTLGTFTMKVREDAASGNAAVTGVSSVKTGDEARASAVTGTNVTIKGVAEPSTTETTAPSKTESSGSQNQTAGQPARPVITNPTFTKPSATTPAETQPEELPGAEMAETVTEPQETAAQQNVQAMQQQEETGHSFLPAIAIGAAILCVVLIVVLIVRKRKH